MIVSHAHRFIFVKTKKTAGTSLEIALSRLCGAQDVITRITPADERVRRDFGGRGPQNELVEPARHTPAERLALQAGSQREIRHYNHEPAALIRQHVGDAAWDGYFKFCVERNPWDRAISLYFWRTRDLAPRPSLAAFLQAPEQRERLSNFAIYGIGDEVAVDRVLRYENLEAEFAATLRQLVPGAELELPRAKAHHREDKRHYRELIGPAERDLIAALCAREIVLFGYEF